MSLCISPGIPGALMCQQGNQGSHRFSHVPDRVKLGASQTQGPCGAFTAWPEMSENVSPRGLHVKRPMLHFKAWWRKTYPSVQEAEDASHLLKHMQGWRRERNEEPGGGAPALPVTRGRTPKTLRTSLFSSVKWGLCSFPLPAGDSEWKVL